MTVCIRLGDCTKYCKVRNVDNPTWHCYEDFKVIDSSELTREICEAYPYEYYSTKTRLFFDYDEKSEDIDYVIQKRKQMRELLIQYSSDYTNGYVFTESTSNPTKISFHVIFKKHNIIRADFIPEDERQLFSKIVGVDNVIHIDAQVYGKKTCFRLPFGTQGCNGHQYDKKHPHLPYVGQGQKLNLIDYVLSQPDDAETKIYPSQLNRKWSRLMEEDTRQYSHHEEKDGNEKLTRMLAMVTLERFKSYNHWLALLVVMKTHGMSLDLFLTMSEGSGYEYFDEIKCRKAWRDCSINENFGIPLVMGWLKQDGVDIKKEFPVQSPIIKDLLSAWFIQYEFTDKKIAEILFTHYKDNLFFTSQGWLHYHNKWEMGKPSDIFYPIIEFLSEELITVINDTIKKKKDDEKIQWVKMAKDANKLQSTSKMKAVLEQAQGPFRNEVLDTFDTKPHWFCFSDNKAFDMLTNNIVTIQATDRILTTCGYPCPEEKQDDVDRTLEMIKELVEPQNLESLLSALSLPMYGENTNEAFVIFKGEGGNGKGMLMSIVEKTLGSYFYSLPSEILTTHSKGGPKPELAQTRWARLVIFTEPDENQMLVKTTINMLTGRDKITVRGLFKDPMTFLPKFVLGGMVNDLPNISGGINDAIKRRLKMQMFPFSFKTDDDFDEKNPTHKRADIRKKESLVKDERVRNGLLWLLLRTWQKNQGKYISCESDKQEARKIAHENNPISEWMEGYHPSETFSNLKTLLTTFQEESGIKLTSQKFKRFLEDTKVRIESDTSNGHKVFLQKKVFREILGK
jgi:phage/plasmid-associated DNA primase